MRSSVVRSRIGLVALAGSSILLLAGCEKPAPSVSVWSGTNSTHAEAACWNHGSGGNVGASACADQIKDAAMAGASVKELSIRPGGALGISVDPEVAEQGWIPSIGGQPLAQVPITETYFKIDLPSNLPPDPNGYMLQIVASADQGARGVWWFKLLTKA